MRIDIISAVPDLMTSSFGHSILKRAIKNKLVEAYGEEHPLLISMADIGTDVRTYVIAKTLISLFTGILIWLFLAKVH